MPRGRAALLGLLAGGLWLALGLWQAPRLGLHIDEAAYLTADLQRQPWFAAACAGEPAAWQPAALQRFWSYNEYDCHPFLLRLLTGLVLQYLPDDQEHLPGVRPEPGAEGGDVRQSVPQSVPRAWRLPNILLGAVAAGAVTAVTAHWWGVLGGLGAAAALLASPRFLAYALLATHDPTVAFLAVLTGLAAAQWLMTPRQWLIVPLALLMVAAKVNALPLACGLVVWAWLGHGVRPAVRLAGLLALAMLGYVLLEPQFRFPGGVQQVIMHHARHVSYPLQLFGRTQADGRWNALYPLAQLASAIPLPHLMLAALALFMRRTQTQGGRLVLLAAVQVLGCLLLAALPGTPKYAGIRVYLLPAFPFLAIMVGYGTHCVGRWLRTRLLALPLLLVLFAPLAEYLHLQPHAALYANALVGGARGWSQAGNETFAEFAHLTPAVLDGLAGIVEPGRQLHITPHAPRQQELYQRLGMPRRNWHGWQNDGILRAGDWLLVYESHIPDPGLQAALAGRQPVRRYAVAGVTILSLYRW